MSEDRDVFAAGGWQNEAQAHPIATAPKVDDAPLLLWLGDESHWYIGFLVRERLVLGYGRSHRANSVGAAAAGSLGCLPGSPRRQLEPLKS